MKTVSRLFFLGCIALLFQSSALQAASFDCKKASTAIEKSICNDNSLGAYDERLAYAYKQLLKHDKASADDLKKEQRAWIAKRNKQCSEGKVECLSSFYSGRVELLEDNLVDKVSSLSKGNCERVYLLAHLAGLPADEPGQLKQAVAHNSLVVDKIDKDHLSFSLDTIGTNAHMCSIRGIAQKQDDSFQWLSTQTSIDDGKQCALDIQFWEKNKYATVTVADEVAVACHRTYCGMRGYLHRAGDLYTVANQVGEKDCSGYKFSYR